MNAPRWAVCQGPEHEKIRGAEHWLVIDRQRRSARWCSGRKGGGPAFAAQLGGEWLERGKWETAPGGLVPSLGTMDGKEARCE